MVRCAEKVVATHRAGALCRIVLAGLIGVVGQLVSPASAQKQPAAGSITIQQPVFGVAVDADGVLKVQRYTDPSGKLRMQHLAAAQKNLPADVLAPSALRKVSLVKLERAIRKRLQAGRQPDETMQYLAGLQRLQYVFFYPKTHDIIVAGPAEGWIRDASARVVGIRTGRATLRLDDLLVALRAYPPAGPAVAWLGCSIGATAKALERVRKFQRTIPRTIRPHQRAQVTAGIANGLRESLGLTGISVFGISPKTHFAEVLVEADYRMKRIGIGLEPPPVKMLTYLGAMKTARHGSWLRWWFVPNYDCVKVTQDGLAMELVGRQVKLLGENMVLLPNGKLVIQEGSKATRPSRIFTTAFTRKYPEIADRSPVFAELRNLIDMAVAAAFIRQQNYYRRADWPMTTLLDETALPTQTQTAPKAVPAAVNVVWKGNRLLAPAGGVSIQPSLALEPDRLIDDKDGKLRERYQHVADNKAADRWWWD